MMTSGEPFSRRLICDPESWLATWWAPSFTLRCSFRQRVPRLSLPITGKLFRTLKTESVDHEEYRTKEAAKLSLFEHIDVYN